MTFQKESDYDWLTSLLKDPATPAWDKPFRTARHFLGKGNGKDYYELIQQVCQEQGVDFGGFYSDLVHQLSRVTSPESADPYGTALVSYQTTDIIPPYREFSPKGESIFRFAYTLAQNALPDSFYLPLDRLGRDFELTKQQVGNIIKTMERLGYIKLEKSAMTHKTCRRWKWIDRKSEAATIIVEEELDEEFDLPF